MKAKFANVAIAAIILFVIISSSFTLAVMQAMQSIYNTGVISYALPLHTEGRLVKDALGNTVYLRGVNKDFLGCSDGFWMAGSDEWYSHWGVWDENVVKANLQGMRNWGVNVMRCCICIDWWLSNYKGTVDNKTSNMPFRDAMIRTIQLARQYGIYAVIAPWSVKAGVGQAALPFPPYENSVPSVIPDVQAWVDFWLNVSRTLRGYDNVILELHNEPAGRPSDMPVWFDAATQAVNAIRADGDDRLIVVQWLYCGGFNDDNWLDTWYNQSRPVNNILFSMHIYRYHSSFGNQFSSPDIDFIRNHLAVDHGYLHAINDLNASIWVGEIGAYTAYTPDQGITDPTVQQDEFNCFNNTLTVLNEWGVGYAAWEWFGEWGSVPGRVFGVISKNWTRVNPPTPPIPGGAGQILLNAIASGK